MLPDPFRTARDIAYLSLGLLTSDRRARRLDRALSLSLSLAILIVGLPVIIGSAYVMRWTAELDRRNAALVFGRPVRGHYRIHRSRSIGGRVLATLRDPQVWRDLAWLITHSVVGFAFGILAITLVGERRRPGDAPALVLVDSRRRRDSASRTPTPCRGRSSPPSWPPRWPG